MKNEAVKASQRLSSSVTHLPRASVDSKAELLGPSCSLHPSPDINTKTIEVGATLEVCHD